MKAALVTGFTLIELLVVITIMGILAVGVFVAINPVKRSSQAQAAVVQADFAQMRARIDEQRTFTGSVLGIITGNWYSWGSCGPVGTDVRNPTCINTQNASWQRVAGRNMPIDPWGNSYSMDENEAEPGFPGCRIDALISAGPDHLFQTADDISYAIPTLFC